MHLKNIYFVNLWLVFCLLFTTACNDDDNIYFTQDEIIGDINSGKQIALENNTLVVYTNNMATSVNVQGAKGKIHATSSDENIVLVTSSNEGKATVLVEALNIGNAQITVTDAGGNSATFTVEAKDGEELWEKRIYTLRGKRQCLIKGVTPSDSAQIAAEAIGKVPDAKWVIKKRSYPFAESLQRMYVYDEENQLLVQGILEIEKSASNQPSYSIYSDKHELLMNYTMPISGYFVKDLTDEYRNIYPEVTEVLVYLPFAPIL